MTLRVGSLVSFLDSNYQRESWGIVLEFAGERHMQLAWIFWSDGRLRSTPVSDDRKFYLGDFQKIIVQ